MGDLMILVRLVLAVVIGSVDLVAAHPTDVVAVLLCATCVVLLARIALLLWADRFDRWARVVAVVPAPPPPPDYPPDPPLVNPMFAAHITATSAATCAALRAGRQPARVGGRR
ncbi:hypothetical protein [Micromonospora craniellae]|uniref:Uncharacterized protein n=1 Tax=Micromonospora craniellae TaxID=2294034 RepID=A0A372G1S6_9ACTN|nr:hypothetical protein [Micromonospora craniellae]QOC89853.1 hypothetical protein ID554_16580 [Micromonospora craniellae]RFS47001.1 hypothetical protein D0Q02_07510 [Micromonospora craniellae]